MEENSNTYQKFLAEAEKRGDTISVISGEELRILNRSISKEIKDQKIRDNCNLLECCLIPLGGNFSTIPKIQNPD